MIARFAPALFALAVMGFADAAVASPMMKTGGDALALKAWTAFCEKRPEECRIDPSEPAVVAHTPENLDLLRAVNDYVNRTITPLTDMVHWNEADRWDFAETGAGDCEDIQLRKRRYLVEAGLPRRALLMTVVIDGFGEGHAVLTVRTDKEDIVLDNQNASVLRWDRTGYIFLKREGETRTGWISILPGEDPKVVAASAQ
jgi:predicted transglutaminase-like cysteine proteinase